jgi:hypothetical protein
MPTFTRGGKVGAVINKNELLDLGDIYNDKATKGGASKGGASVAAEQDNRPKCEQSGSFQMAQPSGFAPRQQEADKAKNIAFGGMPTFTRSSKPKAAVMANQGPGLNADIHEKQTYDFSKFQMSSASVRRPREPVAEGEEGKQEEGAEKPVKTAEDKPEEIRERRHEKRQQ